MKLVFELEGTDYDRLTAGAVPYIDVPVTEIEARCGIEQTRLGIRFVEGVTARVALSNGVAADDAAPAMRLWLKPPAEEVEDGSNDC